MKLKMKEKKAQYFESGLVIVMIAACFSALYAFALTQKKIETSITPPKISGLYEEKEKIIFYAEESARLSAEKAFFDISLKGAVFGEKCKPCYEDYVRWNEECKPDGKTEKQFIEKTKQYLDEYMNNYEYINYSVSLENEKLVLKAEKANLSMEEKKGFLHYKAFHYFDPSFTINNTFAFDFTEIYKTAKNKFDICKKEENREECMRALFFGNWNMGLIERKGNCTALILKTRKKFFFLDKGKMFFDNIEIKFAFE